MSRKPSEPFTTWLDEWLKKGSPGQALPSVSQLARHWNISTATVRRRLEEYQRQSRIIRIPGRGSIIPPLHGKSMRPPVTRRYGWEYTAEALIRAITQGRFRKGRPLPSIKHLSLQFHISRASAIRAYKHLEAAGFIEKIGKRFWAGKLADGFTEGTRRTIVVFIQSHSELERFYSNNRLGMTAMLTAMENELARNAYEIQYEDLPRLGTLMQQWISTRDFPHGVIIWANQLNAVSRLHPVQELLELLNRHAIPTLVWSALGPMTVPSGVTLFSHGNTFTQQMRTAADYIISSGYRSGVLFLNDPLLLSSFQRVYPELLLRDPGFQLHIVLDCPFDPDRYFAEMNTATRRALSHFLGKYRKISLEDFKRLLVVSDSLDSAFRRFRKRDIWLFALDEPAAQALKWARSNNMKIPEETAVLGFENNPRFYEYGISSCIKDEGQTGYLLAHSLIRDIPIEKTTHGFIKTEGLILHRKTTLAAKSTKNIRPSRANRGR